MSCKHYNAKLLLLRKTSDFTQKQKELRKTIKYSKTIKLCKHNGIMHIHNSWQIQIEAGRFARPMPHRWRGDVTVDTQCLFTKAKAPGRPVDMMDLEVWTKGVA